MNTELAMANIRSRMRDMGYAETDYSTTPKYFVLQGDGHLDIEAYQQRNCALLPSTPGVWYDPRANTQIGLAAPVKQLIAENFEH